MSTSDSATTATLEAKDGHERRRESSRRIRYFTAAVTLTDWATISFETGGLYHEVIKCWLAQHPRFDLDFMPTASLWLNLVERCFAEITRKGIHWGNSKNVSELVLLY